MSRAVAVSKKPPLFFYSYDRDQNRFWGEKFSRGSQRLEKNRMLFRGHLPRGRADTLIGVVQVGRATLARERPAAYKLCQKRRRNTNRAAEFNAR